MIRRLAPADVEQLAPLFAAYLEFYGVEHPAERQRGFLSDRLTAENSVAFGAFDSADRMTGFALCHLAHNSLRLAPAWILHDLFVAPDCRRQGTASALLEVVHEAARGAGACEVVLSTARDNRAATALYKRTGYSRDEFFRTFLFDLR